jgi:hypothetical protein
MHSHNRSYFPKQDAPNPYAPPSRPQTSHSPVLNNLPSYNLNKSYGRLPAQQQGYGSVGPRQNMSRSKVSMASSHVSELSNLMAEHTDIFPDELVFLLCNEEKNINVLKEKIEREKGRVENDFAIFRTEIDHIMEDVKISVQAELDLVYKTYITKYAEIKGEVQELRLLRKEILMNNQAGLSNGMGFNTSISNKDLIHEIERDAEHMRNFKIYGYLGELQKQKLEPILSLSNELVMIGAAECNFYRNKELSAKLKEVKQHFGSFIKEVFDNLNEYVITPQLLVERERQEMENSKEILREFDQASVMKPFDVHFPSNSRD